MSTVPNRGHTMIWDGTAPIWAWLSLLGVVAFCAKGFLAVGSGPPSGLHGVKGNDPKVGALLPVHAALLHRVPTYLLIVSGCSCNAVSLRPLLQKAGADCPVALDVIAPESKFAVLRRSLPKNVAMVDDPDGKISDPLNVLFLPRAYVVGSSGGLIWIQEDPNLNWVRSYEIAARVARLARRLN